jgi:hypothetical protein
LATGTGGVAGTFDLAQCGTVSHPVPGPNPTLTLAAPSLTVACAGPGGGTIGFSGTLNTTISLDWTDAFLVVDGVAQLLDVIPRTSFTPMGRTFTYTWSYSAAQADGTVEAQICFVGSPSIGQGDQCTCTDPAIIPIGC